MSGCWAAAWGAPHTAASPARTAQSRRVMGTEDPRRGHWAPVVSWWSSSAWGRHAYISKGALAPRGMTFCGGCMSNRIPGLLVAAVLVLTSEGWAQGATAKEPVADGRTLSQWVADLKAVAPQTRNAA